MKNLKLYCAPLTKEIFIGKIKNKETVEKINVTNNFIAAIIEKFCGFEEIFTDSKGNKYSITVLKILEK